MAYIYDLVDTWNDGATTFTAIKMNVTDTASNAASLLMDLQVGGVARFRVDKLGGVISRDAIQAVSGGSIGFYNSNTLGSGSQDVFLTRKASANLRFGAADAATAQPQILSVQSVVAGTSNTAGANLTITGSQGTGNAAGGSIIFQVAPAGSSGTAQNALATAFQITSAKNATFFASVTATNTSGGSTMQLASTNSSYGYHMAKDYVVSWGSGATLDGSLDVILARDAANTLALRNGTAAQAFRVYNTYTDATTFERANIFWDSNVLKIGTEKGSVGGTARALEFQTDGTTALVISTGQLLQFAGTTSSFPALKRVTTALQVRLADDSNFANLVASAIDPYGSITLRGSTESTRRINVNGLASIRFPADGVYTFFNDAGTDFGRLQFGGTTSSFPALKRSTTILQTRLADDSAFATIQGKLRADVNAVAETPTATHTITITDAAGTAYKVLCVAA